MRSTQKVSGHREKYQGGFNLDLSSLFWPSRKALVVPPSIQKPSHKHLNRNFLSVIITIQEPVFSVSNTEFEGGDDGCGILV
jgi:hypothetical protein